MNISLFLHPEVKRKVPVKSTVQSFHRREQENTAVPYFQNKEKERKEERKHDQRKKKERKKENQERKKKDKKGKHEEKMKI